MAHFPKPFFKASRGTWYVEIDRKQINLGTDKKEAFDRYHELKRQKPQNVDCTMAIGVIDAYLGWVRQNKSLRTYEWYLRHCQVFAKSIPATLSVAKLKPHHLSDCIAKQTGWSSTTKNGLCRAVQRAFRWAEDEERILRSPIARFKKPKAKRREVVIPVEEFLKIKSLSPNEAFRALIDIAWETGARPQEILAVEARHVDLVTRRWVFPAEESRGKQYPRVVYLNNVAFAITRRLIDHSPTGKLFRNEDGKPWTRFAVNCAFCRLQASLGMEKLKIEGITLERLPCFKKPAGASSDEVVRAREQHSETLKARRKNFAKLTREKGKKFSLYHFRHSWGTRAIQRGVDPLTVAMLMGHADPTMLAKVYAHLAHDPEYLRKSLDKVTADSID